MGKRGPPPRPLADRFWPKVQKSDGGCWLWTASRHPRTGYGTIGRGGRNGGSILAHRAAWELTNGPIPDGLEIDHVKARGCTSRACVNPAHLEPVTARENLMRSSNQRMLAFQTRICLRGHAMGPTGKCRECARMIRRAYESRPEVRAKRRAADNAYNAAHREERRSQEAARRARLKEATHAD